MFNKSKLDDGGELYAHVEPPFGLVLANVNGRGHTVWQKRMTSAEARDLRDFLITQDLGDRRENGEN